MHLSEWVGMMSIGFKSVLLTAMASGIFIVLALLLRWDCASKLGRIERGELNDEPERYRDGLRGANTLIAGIVGVLLLHLLAVIALSA